MIIFLFSQGVGSTFHLKRRLLTDHPSFWFLSSDITRNSFSSGQKAGKKSFSIKRKNICSSVSVSKVLKAVKYKYEEEMIYKINIGSGCDLNWWGKLWANLWFCDHGVTSAGFWALLQFSSWKGWWWCWRWSSPSSRLVEFSFPKASCMIFMKITRKMLVGVQGHKPLNPWRRRKILRGNFGTSPNPRV